MPKKKHINHQILKTRKRHPLTHIVAPSKSTALKFCKPPAGAKSCPLSVKRLASSDLPTHSDQQDTYLRGVGWNWFGWSFEAVWKMKCRMKSRICREHSLITNSLATQQRHIITAWIEFLNTKKAEAIDPYLQTIHNHHRCCFKAFVRTRW